MTSYAESEASFRNRAREIQLTEQHVEALLSQDIRCFNHFAFTVGGQPGQLDETKFQDLVNAVCPRGASLGVQAALKQLAYESITVAVAAIRQRVESGGEAALRKLPAHERDERLRRIRQKITGFEIAGDYEPAHSVVDTYAHMIEEGALRILPLSKCISRDQELQANKQDKQLVLLEGQQLTIKDKQLDLKADLSNELRVHNAFIRRGLAMEMANLASFSVHERAIRDFMSYLTKDVPPGFKGPTVESVLRADKELWTLVANECRSNLKPTATGGFPVDDAIQRFSTSASVLFNLLPLPSSASSSSSSSTKRKQTDGDDEPPKPPAKVAKRVGPRNLKGRQQRRGQSNLPPGLHGYSGWNSEKQRICYNYNLPHGCQLSTTKDGQVTKCSRGTHQCIKCHGPHPLAACSHN